MCVFLSFSIKNYRDPEAQRRFLSLSAHFALPSDA